MSGSQVSATRKALYRRLWSNVRHLPGGEETMRDMVAVLRDRDGTGTKLMGTEDYTSVKQLTVGQLKRLIAEVEERMDWPERRRAKGQDNVAWLISQKTRSYIRYLATELGWDNAALQGFCERQIKRTAPATRKQASALIEPMERMLAERGRKMVERKGRKWWDPPSEGEP